MFPLILAGLAMGAAAYFAYKLLQSMRSGGLNLSGGNQAGDEPGSDRTKGFDSIKNRDDLINKVVNSVVFATKQMVVGQKKVGEERLESEIPADDMEIRKMRGISEISKVVPQANAYNDDLYYGLAATNQLMVTQHIETKDLTEPEYGKARNILLVLQDISGSMDEYDRIPWSIRLNEKLIERCQKEEAEYALICFDGNPREPHLAKNKLELESLKSQLVYIIRPAGGTSISSALRKGITVLTEEQFAEKQIILVTDGQDGVSFSLKQEIKTAGASLHAICIAGDNPDLRAISDKYDILEQQNNQEEDN